MTRRQRSCVGSKISGSASYPPRALQEIESPTGCFILFIPMPKKSISSLELTALVQELQSVVHSKISQIYHQQDKEVLLQLHLPGTGQRLLRIIPGKFLCLTNKKETSLTPTGFCMQLRKHLDGAFLQSLSQPGSERIVVLVLEKKSTFYLIIELFSKGNIVLTDEKYTIIGVLEQQTWKDRTIKPGEKYLFPAAAVDWKRLSEKEFMAMLSKSDKRNLATSLATDIGLGGLYAEEVCRRAGVDKTVLPTAILLSDLTKLYASLRTLITLLAHPQGYIYSETITPFPVLGAEPLRITTTYNEAIDTLNPFQAVSPYEKRIVQWQRTIAGQELAVVELQGRIAENTAKGEQIYQQYATISKLLELIQKIKEAQGWSGLTTALQPYKKIKHLNLKNKRITVEL